MTRVLHLDTGHEFRGGQRQVLLLARGLARWGYGQVVLAPRGAPLYAQSLACGIDTLPLGPAAVVRESRRADVIHAHDARAHTWAVLAAGDRPVVVSRRVAFPVGGSALSRWKYRRASRYLAISEFVKRQLLAAGIEEDRISVVYDGVEIANHFVSTPHERFALAPATADPQKGSALAAEACRTAGIELKFSAALEEDLPRAALFLYLTFSEGLGSAILLAMAQGVPVVASRVGGIPEIVEHGHTGLLVENTPAAVVSAIHNVLVEPASAATRAQAARARLLGRFTDAIMVAQTEQAYRLTISHGQHH